MNNVVPLRKPRVFTTAEALIEEVRAEIFRDKGGYKNLAERCGVSRSTISNLAIGRTRWPRPTTMFPLLEALGLELRVTKKGQN